MREKYRGGTAIETFRHRLFPPGINRISDGYSVSVFLKESQTEPCLLVDTDGNFIFESQDEAKVAAQAALDSWLEQNRTSQDHDSALTDNL
jgi:hypothetical protein